MADRTPVKLFRISVRTWEHEVATQSFSTAPCVAASKRILPAQLTDPIYERLSRTEEFIKRHSEPFPPYDFRLFPIYTEDDREKFEDAVAAPFRLIIDSVINRWDDLSTQELQKLSGAFRTNRFTANVPRGDFQIRSGYEIRLDIATWPDVRPIADLLAKFAHSYKPPAELSELEQIHLAQDLIREMEASQSRKRSS
jgi:hypothetical protein